MQKWYEYLDESDIIRERSFKTSTEYFNTYKWWLKREYQAQTKTK